MNPACQAIAAIIAAAAPMERPEFAAPEVGPKASGKTRQRPAEMESGRVAAGPDSSPDPDPLLDVASEPTRAPPSAPLQDDAFDLETTLTKCALLDHSDTDNGERLRAYFGRDLTVRAEAEIPDGSFLCWTGTHWDIEGGAAGASLMAQEVGPLIKREADFLRLTSAEEKAVAAAADARAEFKDATLLTEDRTRELEETIRAGKAAQAALAARRAARRKFGVGSKNAGRIDAMKKCAAPHMREPLEVFNSDPLMVATKTHTLRFVRTYDMKGPDPTIKRVERVSVEAIEGHRREHKLTSVVPWPYVPGAAAPRWLAFMERFQPVVTTRRTVQQFSAIGMTGLQAQRFMLHHGAGANGKSVFLEVLTRVLGSSIAIGLPVESIMGNSTKSGSQASPDIARLFGKRMVRVVELPRGQPLSVDVVKKLTGGEAIPVRTLYKGIFEFTPVCTPHFSTNGEPQIDDESNGIWRRMFAVEWPVTLAESEQRDFDEVVGELVAEAHGIINWLIEGLLDYLQNGFVVSDGIRESNQGYRDAMDPTGPFARDCVRPKPGSYVQARDMYEAYVAWSFNAAMVPVKNAKFGRLMKHKVRRDDTQSRHRYIDVELHDVPLLSEEQRVKAGLSVRRPAAQPAEQGDYVGEEISF